MNLKYAFYRDYYVGFDPRQFDKGTSEYKTISARNEDHFRLKNKRIGTFQPTIQQLAGLLPNQSLFGERLKYFTLFTTYPGLFSGSGYNHETGSVGELKLGFFFDHTSGLPILPGHSIKGAIRSVFPRRSIQNTKEPTEIKNAKAEYILEILAKSGDVPAEGQRDWVDKLENHIFEGVEAGHKENKLLPMSQRDVFLDTVIVRPDRDGKIVGTDAITPHGNNPLNNPIPLAFLKVLPGVEWQFSFVLNDSKVGEITVTKDQKKLLFESILLDNGVGAKTNVGYGAMTKELPTQKGSKQHNKKATKQHPFSKWKNGAEIEGVVVEVDKVKRLVYFSSELISDFDKRMVTAVRQGLLGKFSIGSKFRFSIGNKEKDANGNLKIRITSYKSIK